MTIHEWRRMYAVLKRQERREKGLCTGCGKSAPREGRRLCEKCLLIKKESMLKPGYIEAAARYRATDEYKRKTSAYNRKRREKYAAQGLCCICGRRPAMPGKRSCAECLKKQAEGRKARKEQGICLRCGKKHSDGLTYCFECRVKMSAAGRSKNGGE